MISIAAFLFGAGIGLTFGLMAHDDIFFRVLEWLSDEHETIRFREPRDPLE